MQDTSRLKQFRAWRVLTADCLPINLGGHSMPQIEEGWLTPCVTLDQRVKCLSSATVLWGLLCYHTPDFCASSTSFAQSPLPRSLTPTISGMPLPHPAAPFILSHPTPPLSLSLPEELCRISQTWVPPGEHAHLQLLPGPQCPSLLCTSLL